MTPNPHRGSDFADFLAEEGLMTPTKDLADALRFGLPMNPIEAVRVCNAAAGRLEELEQQLAANHEAIKLIGKWLEDERALADRLASALTDSATWSHALPAYEAWKKARHE
jgi:hypothetical protein